VPRQAFATLIVLTKVLSSNCVVPSTTLVAILYVGTHAETEATVKGLAVPKLPDVVE
jgi:hypothetical protein